MEKKNSKLISISTWVYCTLVIVILIGLPFIFNLINTGDYVEDNEGIGLVLIMMIFIIIDILAIVIASGFLIARIIFQIKKDKQAKGLAIMVLVENVIMLICGAIYALFFFQFLIPLVMAGIGLLVLINIASIIILSIGLALLKKQTNNERV